MKAIRTQLEAYDAEFVRVQMWLDTQEEKLTSMRVFTLFVIFARCSAAYCKSF